MILQEETDNMCGGYTGEHEQMNIKKIHLVETKKYMGGVQKVYKSPNGYGASVIKHEGSYGFDKDQWELAVLKDDELCYSTGITSDVMGYLNDPQVDNILRQIANLEVDIDA